MISTPNRLLDLLAKIESGQDVDWGRVAMLQSLDLVIAGRQFVEDAIRFQESENDRIDERLGQGRIVGVVAGDPTLEGGSASTGDS